MAKKEFFAIFVLFFGMVFRDVFNVELILSPKFRNYKTDNKTLYRIQLIAVYYLFENLFIVTGKMSLSKAGVL